MKLNVKNRPALFAPHGIYDDYMQIINDLKGNINKYERKLERIENVKLGDLNKLFNGKSIKERKSKHIDTKQKDRDRKKRAKDNKKRQLQESAKEKGAPQPKKQKVDDKVNEKEEQDQDEDDDLVVLD